MMVGNSVLTIIPAFLLLTLALFARAVQGNWLAPGAFFSLYWSVFTFIVLISAPEFTIYPAALWAIVLIIFSFQAGALIAFPLMAPGNNRHNYELKSSNVPDWLTKRMYRLTFLLTIISGVGVALLVSIGIKMFGFSFSMEGLLQLGNAFSVLRYEGSSTPLPVKVFLYWVYPAALLGGLFFCFARTRREKIISILPFFIALLNGIVVAARAGILLSVVLWFSGFLSMRIYMSRGKYKVFRFKNVLLSVTSVLLLVVIYFLLQWIRGGAKDIINIGSIYTHMKAGLMGILSAFTTWYNFPESSELTLGAYTFAGPFNLLGLAERAQGLYSVPVYFESGGFTNIYTVFRGLIQDFSLLGTLIIFFILGYIFGLSYRYSHDGDIRWVLPLSIFYAFTLCSNLTSIFVYNSIVAAWVVAMVVWFLPEVKGEHLAGNRSIKNHE